MMPVTGAPKMVGQEGSQTMMRPSMLPSLSQIPEDTPPGLEFLIGTTAILIQQEVELGEVLTGINTNNRYNILDQLGRRIYFAGESSSVCRIFCMGRCRAWTINIFDCFGQKVMVGTRKSSCCGRCGNTVQVTTAQGEMIGGVMQSCKPVGILWIAQGLKPSVFGRLVVAYAARVAQPAARSAEIRKHFGDLMKEMFTAADTFGVSYPMDLDVKLKATLIFATFMIDFMYYEEQPDEPVDCY